MNFDLQTLPATADELTPVQHAFAAEYIANGGNATAAYRTAFRTNHAAVRVDACRLLRAPAVAAYVRALKAAAAERTVVSLQQQLVDLDAMATVDVSELWRLEYRPCPACLKLYDADLLAGRALPDMSQGLPPHALCRDVHAHQHVVMIPMDQWPPAARKLYNGLEMQKDGTLRPTFRDRNSIQDQVNRLLSGYVTRSVNLNATIPTAATLSPFAAARLNTDDMLKLVWSPQQ